MAAAELPLTDRLSTTAVRTRPTCRLNKVSPLLFAIVAAFATTVAFAQSGCLPTPSLLEPSNGAPNLDATVTFKWSAVPGSTNYEVWASTDGAAAEQLGTTTSTSFVAQLTRGSSVDWYVVAIAGSCRAESQHFRFTTFA